MAEMKEAKAEHRSEGKKLSHIEMRKAKGGHVVTHHYHSSGMEMHKPKDHVFSKEDGAAMMAHVARHMGVQQEAAAEGEPKRTEAAEQEQGE